jgi:hypothetical protein
MAGPVPDNDITADGTGAASTDDAPDDAPPSDDPPTPPPTVIRPRLGARLVELMERIDAKLGDGTDDADADADDEPTVLEFHAEPEHLPVTPGDEPPPTDDDQGPATDPNAPPSPFTHRRKGFPARSHRRPMALRSNR